MPQTSMLAAGCGCADFEPGLARQHLDLVAVVLDLVLVLGDQVLPAFCAQFGHAAEAEAPEPIKDPQKLPR
jgi:hypothetical protein